MQRRLETTCGIKCGASCAVSGPAVNLIRPITQTERCCSVEGSGTTVPEFGEASDTKDDDAVDWHQNGVERGGDGLVSVKSQGCTMPGIAASTGNTDSEGNGEALT